MPGHPWGRRAPLARLGGSPIEARHFRRRTRLVDEHQPVDVDVRLKGLHTARSAITSGRSRSLACAVFFKADGTPLEEAPDHARHEALAVCREQAVGPPSMARHESVQRRPGGSYLHLRRPELCACADRAKGLRHQGWPPSPALSVNHDLPIQGNTQSDSTRSENASRRAKRCAVLRAARSFS